MVLLDRFSDSFLKVKTEACDKCMRFPCMPLHACCGFTLICNSNEEIYHIHCDCLVANTCLPSFESFIVGKIHSRFQLLSISNIHLAVRKIMKYKLNSTCWELARIDQFHYFQTQRLILAIDNINSEV